MEIYSLNFDDVIKSNFIVGATDYEYALKNLYPLIDRLPIQRNIQNEKLYRRLEKDLVSGCIMPPLTVAFVDEKAQRFDDIEQVKGFIEKKIDEGFILDGIQRLNTLNRTYRQNNQLDLKRVLFVNILICSSTDNLLYRMITLNNGQKPMSARHQIEILADNIFDFEEDTKLIYTEKETKRNEKKIKISFNKADFIKAYLGFLANSINIENQKIIEEKLDALIADKILESNITDDNLEFSEIVELIKKLSTKDSVYKWFKNGNNLIGFCVGIRTSYSYIKNIDIIDFEEAVYNFNSALTSFNISKIKLSRQRRITSSYFIKNFEELQNFSENDLIDVLSQID